MTPGDADTVAKITSGVIRNVSVGYLTHEMTEEPRRGGVPLRTATDWEPVEISAVPIPADPGSQIRSNARSRTRCTIRRVDGAADRRRVAEILALGKRAGFPNLARKHADRGTSTEDFTTILLGRMAERNRSDRATTRRETTMPNETRDYERGAARARELLARRDGNAPSEARPADRLAGIRAHRREADRADERRMNEAIDFEAGKRMAERLAQSTGVAARRPVR